MSQFVSALTQKVDRLLNPIIEVLHLRLKLTPNQISVIGFLFGLIATGLILFNHVGLALVFLAISQVFDGLDGGVARRFNLESKTGERLDVYLDRSNEFFLFLALAYIGQVSYSVALLAFLAILLMTSLAERSKFDPGFKRISLYIGYFVGFELVLKAVFWVNLIGFVVSMLTIEYKDQQEKDRRALVLQETVYLEPKRSIILWLLYKLHFPGTRE